MRRSVSARTPGGWRLLAAGAVGAAAVAVHGAAPAATGPSPHIRAFKPTADTYVTAARPSANFGRAQVLRVDGAPVTTTYLRFGVGNLTSGGNRSVSATLLLHTRNARRARYEVRRVDEDGWNERRLTYANAPPLSLRYAASRPVRRGLWSAVDVTPFLDAKEEISLAITTRGRREVSFSSRESRHGPRLVVRERDVREDGSGAGPSGDGAPAGD